MGTKINRRSVTPPREAPNRTSIEALVTAVSELGGAIGSDLQRAVRVCELVDAGILALQPNGQLGRSDSVDELGIIDIADVTGLTAALAGKVAKAGDTMTGALTVNANITIGGGGRLVIGPVGGEGGELVLSGAGGSGGDAVFDSLGDNFRWFGGAASPLTFNRATGVLAAPAAVIAVGNITAQAGHFVGHPSYAVLAAGGASGDIYLRPRGMSDPTAQTVVANNGDLIVASAIYPGGAGTCYLSRSASDRLAVNQNLSVQIDLNVGGNLSISGQTYATGWLRSTVTGQGWYHDVHGGGIYMTDSTWVRVYNNKSFRVDGGNILTTGYVECNSLRAAGVGAQMAFQDRTHLSDWLWYGQSSIARLYNASFGGDRLQIDASSNVYAADFIASSDARLKTDVVPLLHAGALIDQLEGKRYTKENQPGVGFIAQDFQRVMPELVRADASGMLGIAYEGVIPVLVEALKDARRRITQLESRAVQ